MKFTGYNEQTHKVLYTNFQRNLKFYKNVGICSFNGYRWPLWSYMHIGKLKELSYLLIFHENELILSQSCLRLHESHTLASTLLLDEMDN